MTSASTETLTFLYTDIEGSTRLWQQYPDAMQGVIARHDQLLREIVVAHGGSVFRTMGDAICAAFHTAPDALRAAVASQRALLREPWPEGVRVRVRMAVHTGAAEHRDGDYTGHTLNRIARLMAAGHGGQILLSGVTRDLVIDDVGSDVTLRDLGEYRLRDLERPEHIIQVEAQDLPRDFPPPRTVSAPETNLPTQATSFVGREAEVTAVTGMLRDPGIRLLTLLGPGGTGKTRLSLRVGNDVLEEYRDGVFFVPLATIRDPDLVASAVASTLGVREAEDTPLEQRLAGHLENRQTLLLLDNFEQVMPAAPLIGRLLAAAPGVKVLVTSRSVLRLAAEHEYAVPPLSLPDPGHLPDFQNLTHYDAVALFIQRAQAIQPNFTVTNANAPAVAEICYRLDGLPLAIELAVARLRLFPPDALLKRLSSRLSVLTGGARDLPARQQTLRGAIDWSYSLLNPQEQRLFARLAVFAGGWTFDAAEAICNLEGDLDILTGLEALVEQSLVRQEESDEPRFSMLETIQEYAAELLDTAAEVDDIRRRHASWFAAPFGELQLMVTDIPTLDHHLAFFHRELDNLRAALRWSLDTGDWGLYARLVGPLVAFWFTRGLWTEGLSWTEAQVPSVPTDHAPERAIVLMGAGLFLSRLGEYDAARGRLEEAIRILRRLDRRQWLSIALYGLGESLASRGHAKAALPLLREALDVGREVNAPNIPLILTYLGNIKREEGDYRAARKYLEEALAITRASGNRFFPTVVLNSLGDLARIEGDYEEARSLYEETERLTAEVGAIFIRPSHLHNLAYIAHHIGNDAQARRQFHEALDLYRDMGDRRGVAECVAGLAVLDAAVNPRRAATLLSAAMSAAVALASRLSPSNQGEYDGALAAIHAHLDETAFEGAWQDGRAMSLDEAVACATERPTVDS